MRQSRKERWQLTPTDCLKIVFDFHQANLTITWTTKGSGQTSETFKDAGKSPVIQRNITGGPARLLVLLLGVNV